METQAVLRLVAEETRHRILTALRQGERPVTDVVRSVGGEQSNVSHHLAMLREAGLVIARRDGRRQLYRIADPEVLRLMDEVHAGAGRLDQVLYSLRLGLPVGPQFHGYG